MPLSRVFQLSHSRPYYGRRKACNTTVVMCCSETCLRWLELANRGWYYNVALHPSHTMCINIIYCRENTLVGFEPRNLTFRVRWLDYTTSETVGRLAVIFRQHKILKLLLSRRSKKQIGENIVNVPCPLKHTCMHVCIGMVVYTNCKKLKWST